MLKRIIAKLKRMYRWCSDRQGYFGGRLFGLRVPVFPLMHLPDGFTVHQVGDTGLSLIENFCTEDEAQHLINVARTKLRRSRITIGDKQVQDDYRTSQTAIVYDRFTQDKVVIPLLHRAGMLFGLPAANVETVFVTRYGENEYYKPHQDFYPGFDGDRLYTVLIYLNDLEEHQGGSTVFEKLNIGVRPKLGRAVVWTNTNPDGSHHEETTHEALPVTNGGEKWAIQLWFRAYEMIEVPHGIIDAPQSQPGRPLTGREDIPAGAWVVGEVEPGSVYAKAFSG
ncbi:MAG: 2OG-Fe(II) oxygenase [Gammaproteobacteria bacterium]|nr:2OG-Fe(II) oxygenase [Gammaproteobacteria bacterium]NND54175.1 2OG-Fe(II) oxygenase [Gammaproteobacteria bacterium]